jgi:hypothetical protein
MRTGVRGGVATCYHSPMLLGVEEDKLSFKKLLDMFCLTRRD